MTVCSVGGCERKVSAHGLCNTHYVRVRRGLNLDEPIIRSLPLMDRFIDKLAVMPSGCWEWTAHRGRGGYGEMRDGKRNQFAHRLAYELFVGPIPEGQTIDHLCRNRPCVNPGHLEVVDMRTNLLRGSSPTAQNARKTHCKHGHEFTPENTALKQGRYRICRTCRARRNREYRRGN